MNLLCLLRSTRRPGAVRPRRGQSTIVAASFGSTAWPRGIQLHVFSLLAHRLAAALLGLALDALLIARLLDEGEHVALVVADEVGEDVGGALGGDRLIPAARQLGDRLLRVGGRRWRRSCGSSPS